MKYQILFCIAIVTIFMNFKSKTGLITVKEKSFHIKKDLLLVQFDCKTDVDDLHTIAAFATLLSNSKFSKIKYHAVAGTYGIQKGLYVPSNDLFKLSFGNNWTDANENFKEAIQKVKTIALKTLTKKGDIWIAEAGQSDFTAALIKAIQLEVPQLNIAKRIHVVQHSNWNEKQTSKEHLQFVKAHTDYQKIADGNEVGNGTPGFKDANYTQWKDKIKNSKLTKIWQLATDLSNTYNGKEGRYNNKAISDGGMDFSDFAEVCWILGLYDIKNTEQYFNMYAR